MTEIGYEDYYDWGTIAIVRRARGENLLPVGSFLLPRSRSAIVLELELVLVLVLVLDFCQFSGMAAKQPTSQFCPDRLSEKRRRVPDSKL
jgi:hypothetical protein